MTDGNPFAFTAADWRSATCLRAKVHGTVAQYRPQLSCPERSLVTVEALHGFLTEALAPRASPMSPAVSCSRPSTKAAWARRTPSPCLPSVAHLGAVMITDEEFEAATRRGEEERARVPAITGVSYRRRQRELVIHFAVGMKLTVPVAIVQGLADAPPAALREVKIEGGGMGLHWPRLDVSLWMPDLLAGITGTRAWMAARGVTVPPPEPGH
jgi:hypothetical protein